MAETSRYDVTSSKDRTPMSRLLGSVLVGIAAACVGGVIITVGEAYGLSSGRMLRDPAVLYDFPAFAGAVSILGVWVMLIGAGVLVFAATVLSGRIAQVLLFIGLGSAAIAIDDQFMLHERVLPNLTGLPEEVIILPYVLIGLAAPLLAAKVMGWRGSMGLWPALVFLGGSVLADTELLGEASYATEDLLKLAGYAAWSGFWISVARTHLNRPRGT